jgi:hypothetical protein
LSNLEKGKTTSGKSTTAAAAGGNLCTHGIARAVPSRADPLQ